jgi:hypothetical protein
LAPPTPEKDHSSMDALNISSSYSVPGRAVQFSPRAAGANHRMVLLQETIPTFHQQVHVLQVSQPKLPRTRDWTVKRTIMFIDIDVLMSSRLLARTHDITKSKRLHDLLLMHRQNLTTLFTMHDRPRMPTIFYTLYSIDRVGLSPLKRFLPSKVSFR